MDQNSNAQRAASGVSLLLILSLTLFGNGVGTVRAEENINQEVTDALRNKIDRGNSFLNTIQSQLNNSQSELQLLKANKSKLRSKITESEGKVRSLQTQLDNLAGLIQNHQEKIAAVSLLKAQYENQVDVLSLEVKDQENYLAMYVAMLDQALSAYYFQTNDFFDGANSDPKLLAFLAYSDTTGEVLKQHDYLLSLQSTTQDIANNIIQVQGELDQKKVALEDKIETLHELTDLLDAQKRNVAAARESQKRLLEETQGKQIIYETLLEISEKEETQVSLQIEKLKENFGFFDQKLNELKQNPDAKGINFDTLSLVTPEDLAATKLKGNAQSPLAWPVSPALGISAFFHDASYKAAMGVEHQAVDIRQAQGSQIRAAADGVVTKASDNGMAYSYIIIAHPGNFLTLYGHVSDIFVKEGEIVKQGEVIGLSGGMPGTKGAGWLTTGPHLHFEVFKDWKHVDPLDYLPLELVPVSSLPDKYLNKLTGETSASKIQRPNE